jgi:hypothetical protein
MRDLHRRLSAYGADLSRWPDGADEARAALLAEPDFRRAWERERDLDRNLAALRATLDDEIARSGAIGRLRQSSGRRVFPGFFSDIPWRRVAAGVLLAGMLGGALGFALPQPAADRIEMALVDPLAGLDASGP